MRPRVLCFGSVNIDDIYAVPGIVQSGQTIASTGFKVLAGGKGANQSVALAKAGGVDVVHGGKVGPDGTWVLDLMRQHGVDTSLVVVDAGQATGRAIIQVSSSTHDNAIVLHAGANHQIHTRDVDSALAQFGVCDLVLLQNEINTDATVHLMQQCSAKGMLVCLNPAPCPSNLAQQLPLPLVDILILNASECASLSQQLHIETPRSQPADSPDYEALCSSIMSVLPRLCILVVTLGQDGVVAATRHTAEGTEGCHTVRLPVQRAVAVQDTTGAGDTFVGFFCSTLAERVHSAMAGSGANSLNHAASLDGPGDSDAARLAAMRRLIRPDLVAEALAVGMLAAGLCCEADGAMPAIPSRSQVEQARSH
ncbi:Ribokinase-like protein [Entophlyctis helioformis]|nr:Ribokinase-like protein [Entophlyctis helioformis]